MTTFEPTPTPKPGPTAIELQESKAAIESLPWVADGTTDREKYVIGHLDRLSNRSQQVFWKLMEKPWISVPEVNPRWELVVRYLTQMTYVDEEAGLKTIEMQFLDAIEGREAASVDFLLKLARSDLDGLHRFLSEPSLMSGPMNGEDLIVALAYLRMADPDSAEAIEALPWVRNGLDEFEMWSVAHLTELALGSQTVFHAVLEEERDWLPPDPWIDVGVLMNLVSISLADESAALKLLEMPFMETIEYTDYKAVQRLAKLSETDPAAVHEFLSHPALTDTGNEVGGITMSTLILSLLSKEAATAIESLPWVQDGIGRSDNGAVSSPRIPFNHEENTVSYLLQIGERSPELLLELVSKPWMQEYAGYLQWRMASEIDELANKDVEAALIVVGMAFMDVLDKDDEDALDMINVMARSPGGELGLRNMLEHQEFIELSNDEHADEISGLIAKIVIDARYPDEAAVINGFPWVQDGIEASERRAMRRLALFVLRDPGTYYSSEVIWPLLNKSWVQDGLTEDEVNAVAKIWSFAHRDEELARRLLEMPFLESVDGIDQSALSTLSILYSQLGAEYVEGVLSHPSLEGGITDLQARSVSEKGQGVDGDMGWVGWRQPFSPLAGESVPSVS